MTYKHIVFDIDGTLIDTEYAVLKSLQETLYEVTNKEFTLDELSFSMGIPGEVTLKKIGIQDTQKVNKIWNDKVHKYRSHIKVFDGICNLLEELKAQGYILGIITSKNRAEFKNDFAPFGLSEYFDTVICFDDTPSPKPSPEPIFQYLESVNLKKEDIIYIGDSIYDVQCAQNAGVDFGLAMWGCRSIHHIHAKYYFTEIAEVLYYLNRKNDPYKENPLLKWIMELRFIAQAGITYCKDQQDKERFLRLREIAAEMTSLKSGIDFDIVHEIFKKEVGFQTPKLDTRAAIFRDNKILLVEEKNGTWSLPGGWVDSLESIGSNTIKEVKEEAGLDIIPMKLIAVQDRNKHNDPPYPFGVCKVFVLCQIIDGTFKDNMETSSSDFFSLDDLPTLALEKNNKEQIELCFKAVSDPYWKTIFD